MIHLNLYYRCAHVFSQLGESTFIHNSKLDKEIALVFVQHFMKPLERFLQPQDIESIFVNIEVWQQMYTRSCKQLAMLA